MKRIVTLMLALMLACGCVFTLASCSLFQKKPEMDLEEAAENLEDAEYSVNYIDDEDELGVGITEALRAYDEDYENYLTITVYAETSTAKIAYEKMKKSFDDEIDSLKLEIKEVKDILKKYEDDMDSDEIDEYEDELKELEKELEEMEDNISFGRSGKTVWAGTKDAIEDSKG